MTARNIDTLLKDIPKINSRYSNLLEKLGLLTVRDLFYHFPFRYEDYSQIVPIDEAYLGETVTVEGRVTKNRINRIFKRRMTITEIVIQDGNNIPLKAVWFNQPFISESLKVGTEVRLSGKLALDKNFLSMSNPAWERSARDSTNTACLVPVYRETRGITSRFLRWQIKELLPLIEDSDDILPEDIRKKYKLFDLRSALTQVHFPDSPEKLRIAQKRFAFEEMFLIQIKTLKVRSEWQKNASIKVKFDEKLIRDFVKKLPFRLTDAQRKASYEILKDLEKPCPMNRLLNGDVGSGKTMVAAISSLQSVKAGYQVAIMAPTEVLAKQHFESFCKIFSNYDFSIALLTNAYKEMNNVESKNNFRNSDFEIDSKLKIKNSKLSRSKLLDEIKSGRVDIIIGTHAIIQKDVRFKDLALVVIDEQHRFGVAQRAALQQETMDAQDGSKKTIPHLLTMTATPIPRTLAIAFFGSLDLSVLDEMPKDRKPIVTKIIPPAKREITYRFIDKEIASGRQAFVILPLVEESKVLTEIKAAVEEHKRLSEKVFPHLNLGLLHGKMKAKEKEKVMQDFKDRKLHILVSTSVVEVGIDVPNSTVMVIEDAERFGLSGLHQFRGRVGRGEHQSYCFLFTQSSSRSALERLRAIEKTNDGFEISQKDLELRGPGQFFGTVQSGLPDIAMENLTNVKLIKFAREEAQGILSRDPTLRRHPEIKKSLERFQERVHLE